MIYQIYYDDRICQATANGSDCIKPFGVFKSLLLPRAKHALYDDEKNPNLTAHNTFCEWRVLYYIWKHFPSPWVGFTSWQHNLKGFLPPLDRITPGWIDAGLKTAPIKGFIVRPLHSVMVGPVDACILPTLKDQFLQWSLLEGTIGKRINDVRGMPMGRYHSAPYWDFVIKEYRRIYGADLADELDWVALGKIDALHTWCNAFIARWSYFDDYMKQFSPIALGLLDFFGSHPIDLELSYICERLIIIYNYIKYSNNELA